MHTGISYTGGVTGSARKHVEELLELSPDERSEAAEALLASLEQEQEIDDSSEVAEAWARGASRSGSPWPSNLRRPPGPSSTPLPIIMHRRPGYWNPRLR